MQHADFDVIVRLVKNRLQHVNLFDLEVKIINGFGFVGAWFYSALPLKMEMDVRLLVLTILSASVKAQEDGPKGRETLLSVILH